MPFTGKLGTDDSRPGNLVYGGAAGGGSPPVPPSPPPPSAEIVPLALPRLLPGIGWALFGMPFIAPVVAMESAPPPPFMGHQEYPQPLFPRTPGVGWILSGVPQIPVPPPPPPPPYTPPGPRPLAGLAGKSFVNLIRADDRRAERAAEKLADIVNSLMRSGQLVQLDAKEWQLNGSGIVEERDPLAVDDSTVGAFVGMTWVNSVTQTVFINTSSTPNAAVWKQITA